MPAFLSQRPLDSRFRGNDELISHEYGRTRPHAIAMGRESRAIPASPPSPPTRHSRLPSFPPPRRSRPPSCPPSVIPTHLSFPRKRESTAPCIVPPKLVPDPHRGFRFLTLDGPISRIPVDEDHRPSPLVPSGTCKTFWTIRLYPHGDELCPLV